MMPAPRRLPLLSSLMQTLHASGDLAGPDPMHAAPGEPRQTSADPHPVQHQHDEVYLIRVSSKSYRQFLIWPLAGLLLSLALAVAVLPAAVHAQPPEPHKYIQEYNGPSTCEQCHGDVTNDVIHSTHYTWEGKLDHYIPLAGTIARINWLSILNEDLDIPGGCGRCHVGDGSLPKPPSEVTTQDKAGLDCLICHSPAYNTSLRFPVQDEDGNWTLTQDRNVLTARQAQRPTSENCLLCHQNVGGGPMMKRGVDFAPVADKHGEESEGDVHADAGMTCVDCHAGQDHKVLGSSPDLWSRDIPDQRLLCDNCHTSAPHTDAILNQHAVRIDCRTCHIHGTGGLVSRDWTAPPNFDPVTELYSPQDDVRPANSVTPTYLWYNGMPAMQGAMWPGNRSDLASRIQPFKQLTTTVPVDAESGEPIPLKLDVFYTEGDLERAIELGADDSGMDYSGAWASQTITNYLQISHGVVSGEAALDCQDCHIAEGPLDFASMGYVRNEVALFESISSEAAGPRQPLRMQVVIPPAQPLPTPVSLSSDIESVTGTGIRVPWNPLLAILLVTAIIVGAFIWLRLQRPKPPAGNQA